MRLQRLTGLNDHLRDKPVKQRVMEAQDIEEHIVHKLLRHDGDPVRFAWFLGSMPPWVKHKDVKVVVEDMIERRVLVKGKVPYRQGSRTMYWLASLSDRVIELIGRGKR